MRITHKDLASPEVDRVVAQRDAAKAAADRRVKEGQAWRARGARRRWLFLAVIAVAGLALAGGISAAIRLASAPRARRIQIGRADYILSREAQKYLRVLEASDYEKTNSVIIIEEPHYSAEGQLSLYRGLEAFFRDNPTLLDETAFLAEGLPAGQPLSVEPLVDVAPDPSDALIHDVLSTFLIPGYIAYEWKHQRDIPIVGVEDANLYYPCAKLWLALQGSEYDEQATARWHRTVVARNGSIANAIIETARAYENPVLFVGGLHLKPLDSAAFRQGQDVGLRGALSTEEAGRLDSTANLGIRDYLERAGVGYTFLVARPIRAETPVQVQANTEAYAELFRAQASGDYGRYIGWLVSRRDADQGVTVTPSPGAAAQYVAAVGEGQTDGQSDQGTEESEGEKNEDDESDKGGESDEGTKNPKDGRIEDGGNDGDKPPHEVDIDGDDLTDGDEISEGEAAEKVHENGNVKANDREQAERIARDAGNGKEPVHDPPHKPGYRPHYHPHGRIGGHVFY
jgi:hypothetical protein